MSVAAHCVSMRLGEVWKMLYVFYPLENFVCRAVLSLQGLRLVAS